MKKRILSVLLVFAMLMAVMPMAFATERSMTATTANGLMTGSNAIIQEIKITGEGGNFNVEFSTTADTKILAYVASQKFWVDDQNQETGMPGSYPTDLIDGAYACSDALTTTSKKVTFPISIPQTKMGTDSSSTGGDDLSSTDFGFGATNGYGRKILIRAKSEADSNVNEVVLDLNASGDIAVSYTITYDAKGGDTTPPAATYTGDAVNLPDSAGTNAGFQLRGWGTSSDGGTTITKVSDPYSPDGNVTLYAIWKADATLVYDLNYTGATGAPTDAGSRAADDEVTLTTTEPTRTGYTFKGWGPANNSAATDKITSKTLAAGTNTVYAIWEAIPVTLTGSNITVKINNEANVPLPTATGGDGTFTYSYTVKEGTMPAGLTLSQADGDTSKPFTLTGTPTAEGAVTITYKAVSGNTAQKEVDITITASNKDAASILGVPTSAVEGKVGGGVTPVITTNSTSPLTFKSSDEAVVTVDANGKLTFVAEGEAVITVSVAEDATYAEASKTYNVKVGPAVTAEPHDAFMFGYEGTKSFGPDDQLTRAQAVTILARLDGWKDGQEVKVDEMFPDVKNIWYYNAIAYAKKAGIVEGFEDGTFQPDKPITRAEFSKMLARMANEGKDPTGTSSALSDAKEHWANVWIGYLETSFPGSIGGREDGLFHPNDDITRAETAKIVNGYLGRLQSVSAKEADQLAADLNKFDDVKRCTWYYNNVMEATVNHESTTEKFHTAD